MSLQQQTSEIPNLSVLNTTVEDQSYNRVVQSLIASSVSNILGCLSGHPLDTIRIRQILEPRKISARQVALDAIKNEGPQSLMKGISQPLIGAVPMCCLVFVVNDYSMMKLNSAYPTQLGDMSKNLLAGGLGGFSTLSLLVPLEMMKCRAQTHQDGNLSISQEARSILKESGIRGLYRGFWAAAWRDVPAWALYFSYYEWAKVRGNNYIDQQAISSENKQKLETLNMIHAGGIAGVLSWVISLPQDVIKTKQQVHNGKIGLTMSDAYLQVIRNGGIRSLYKGCGPTFARGYLVNAVTLPMYDSVIDYIREQ